MQVNWSAAVLNLNGSVFHYYLVELFSGAVGSGSFVTSAQVTATSKTFTGLDNGTSYYGRVTVYTTDPNNSDSSYVSIPVTSSSEIPFRAPDAPESVIVTAGDEQMQVDWSAAVLNGSAFTSFGVQLFNNNTGFYDSGYLVTSENTLSHTFTGLTNGTSYYARVIVNATNPNDSSPLTGGPTDSESQIAFGDSADAPTLAYYPGYQTLRVDWSNVELNGGHFELYKVQLYDSSGNKLSEVTYSNENQNTHTFTELTIGVNYVAKVIVVTSDPNASAPASEGDVINGPAGSITASPHDNPIIIGSAMIDNSTKTVSVTVDKNGSNITDYMAIVQPGNYMQKINDSSPSANSNGTFTLSLSFNNTVLYPSLISSDITSALMVVGNSRGFTAVEFNGSTQTVLSPEHYRDLP
jgi:hypothetical protein